MSLERTKLTVRKVAHALTDPQPQFVSLVSHGANQTPFRVVKSAGDAAADQQVVIRGAQIIDVQKIVFDKKDFPTTESADAYLAEHGYANFDLTSKGKTFEAVGTNDDELLEDCEVVQAQKGVMMTIGVKKTLAVRTADTETHPVADVAIQRTFTAEARRRLAKEGKAMKDGSYPIEHRRDLKNAVKDCKATKPSLAVKEHIIKCAKSLDACELLPKGWKGAVAKKSVMDMIQVPDEEEVKKYDDWIASYSDDHTIGEVIADGMTDEMPPGMYQVLGAYVIALGNCLRDGDMAGVTALGAELSDITIKLVQLYAGLNPEEVEKMMTTANPSAATEATKAAGSAADPNAAPAAATATETHAAPEGSAEAAATATATQKTGEAEEVAAPSGSNAELASIIGSAITAAVKPLSDGIAALSESVAKTTSRMDVLEEATKRQSRQSEDDVAVLQNTTKTQTEEAKKADNARNERQLRHVLGV